MSDFRVSAASEDNGDAARPCFLLGAPRSGTSLLYKLLCLHPDAAYISNWVRRFPHVPALALLNRIGRRVPDAQQQAWFGKNSNAYVYGTTRLVKHRVFPSPVEGEPVFTRCGIGTDPPYAASEAQLQNLRQSFGSIARYGGGRVVLNKRIANNRRIPLLLEAFPEARFLHIVRDGRAVACSLARVDWWEDSVVWWYGGTPRAWAHNGGNPWEICGRNWVEELRAVEHGLEDVAPERRLVVHYEDVMADPLGSLREVAEFAGLSPNDAWERAVTSLHIADEQRWRGNIDAEALKRLESIQSDALAQYGYITDEPESWIPTW